MNLTAKLQSDYIALAAEYLYKIAINSVQDFDLLKTALQTITNPSNAYVVAPYMLERIRPLKEVIDSPESYVHDPSDYQEFRTIIIDQVKARIQKIESLSLEAKEEFIGAQQQERKITADNQERMRSSEAPRPDTEAHTGTEEQWFSEQQVLFQRDGLIGSDSQLDILRQNMADFDAIIRDRVAVIRERAREYENLDST